MSIQGSRPDLLHLVTLGMETSCLYAGLALMKEGLGWGLFPFLLILLSYPIFSLLPRMWTARGQAPRRRRTFIIFGLVFILAPPALHFMNKWFAADFQWRQADLLSVLFQTALCTLLWWLGTVFMSGKTGYHHVHVRFQIAALIMLLFVLLGVDRVEPVISFSIFAFTALALARFDSSASMSVGTLKPLKTRTLAPGFLWILAPVTIMLLVLSPELSQSLLRILGGAAGGFFRWMDRVAVPPSPGKPMQISLFSGCRVKAPRDESFATGRDPVPDGPDGGDLIVLVVAVAGMIVVVAFLFFKITGFRIRMKDQTAQGIAFETASLRAGFLNALRTLLAKICRIPGRLARLMRKVHAVVAIRPGAGDGSLSTPRALYRALLQWAAGQGIPRSISQTPGEYLLAMSGRFPEKDRELALITQVYIQARYGRFPPGGEEFGEAVTAWKRMHQKGA